MVVAAAVVGVAAMVAVEGLADLVAATPVAAGRREAGREAAKLFRFVEGDFIQRGPEEKGTVWARDFWLFWRLLVF